MEPDIEPFPDKPCKYCTGNSETAHAELRCWVDLELADSFIPGWKIMVLLELDRMRREMPYADTLYLRLSCERRPLP